MKRENFLLLSFSLVLAGFSTGIAMSGAPEPVFTQNSTPSTSKEADAPKVAPVPKAQAPPPKASPTPTPTPRPAPKVVAPAPKVVQPAPPKAVVLKPVAPSTAPAPNGSILKAAPYLGSPKAAVSLLVVSDFQCPVCRRAALPMEDISKELGDDLVIYFIHNPLKMHRRAMDAALASNAAGLQSKFWPYHDLLFAEQRRLTDADLTRHAKTLGLDLARFDRDRADPIQRQNMTRQASLSSELGARGTPAFFINGKKSVGWGSKMGLVSQLRRELKATKQLMSGGLDFRAAYIKRVQSNSEKPALFLQNFAR